MIEFIRSVKMFCDEKEDVTFYKDYSGRGMFGKTCIGFSSDNICKTLIELTEYLKDADFKYIADIFGKVCFDNMGLGMVCYFPNLSWDCLCEK